MLVTPLQARQVSWTEKQMGEVILKADRAARQQNWSRAITYGERVLQASAFLDRPGDVRHLNLLNNVNDYYDRAGRLEEVADRVITTYELCEKHLPPHHPATRKSRHLYYKLLLARKNYPAAIRLIRENITRLDEKNNDPLARLRYLEQLATLYGLTQEFAQEEETLRELLALTEKRLGNTPEDNRELITLLAQNYCRQKNLKAFEELIRTHDLKFFCQ